jgi:hypothetical protein
VFSGELVEVVVVLGLTLAPLSCLVRDISHFQVKLLFGGH